MVARETPSSPSTGSTGVLEYNVFEEQVANSLVGNLVNDARLSLKYTVETIRNLRYQVCVDWL